MTTVRAYARNSRVARTGIDSARTCCARPTLLEQLDRVAEVEHAKVAAAALDGIVHCITQDLLALPGQAAGSGGTGNIFSSLWVRDPVKVEIFSDVVCPWCAIGKRRFEAALEHFAHRDEVDVIWRAFELDPEAPKLVEGDLASHLAAKYGMTREQSVASQERLAAMAAEEGLEFHFDRARRANTFDAHRLLHHALGIGRQDALKERLFVAYFRDGEAISDRPTLVRLAEESGVDAAEANEVLVSGLYADAVRADEADARALGITGVPFFVIDRQFGVSGAQSPETILELLDEVWADNHSGLVVTTDAETKCDDESCTLPT
jgi:predicted DsbA family dithiol-disulfide isomerase